MVGDGERIERVVEGRESIFLWEWCCCSLGRIDGSEGQGFLELSTVNFIPRQ